MLESIVKSKITCDRLRGGSVGKYVDGFIDWLLKKNFKPTSVETKLRSLAGWADWLATDHKGLVVKEDWMKALEVCCLHLEATKKVHYSRGPNDHSIVAAKTFIKYLQDTDVVPKVFPKNKFGDYQLLEKYRTWLKNNRGLQDSTLDLYLDIALDFVKLLGDDPKKYSAKSVREFIYNRAKPHSVARAQGITTGIRSFLRYLGTIGLCSLNLADAVPSYSSYNLQSLPKYLDDEDVQKIVDSCVTTDPYGIRDHAIILLLSRLGLRAGDISQMSFLDFNWKNGTLAVCGKGRRREQLPLPQDVGDAVLRYIKEVRPAFTSDKMFLKIDAPIAPLTRQAVSHTVRSAIKRAKVNAPTCGAHVLRHSAATTMLKNGVSLPGISAILRHQLQSTTPIYAKVDLASLSLTAQPWMGGQSVK